MTADPLADDIRRVCAGLVRGGLRDRGELETVERFRDRDLWTVRLVGDDTYVVAWREDGETICTIPADSVALAVAVLRTQRADRIARRN